MKTHKIKLDGKEVFLTQRGDTFKVVKPWKNENGSINWFNLLVGGSWWNLIITAVVVIIILGLFYEYSSNIQTLINCFADPVSLDQCKDTFGYKEILP